MKTLRILSGGAAEGLVEALRPGFEATTGCAIDGVFGAVGAMKARLLSGEPADLVILSRALIDELALVGHVVAASARDIGVVQTAIAVRRGDVLPTVGSPQELREILRVADEIHLPDPVLATAGIHFAKVLRELGIWDEVAGRLKPAPNGTTAMRALAASTRPHPIGCTQATEILSTPGIVLVAPLPPGCELATTYCCAVTAHATNPEAAAALIALLAGDGERRTRGRLGFD
jgi:molybdate transport system substrate-binding protein